MNKFKFDWNAIKTKVKKQEEKKTNWKENSKDVRFYYPQFKDDGTAEAVIRFLPQKVVNGEFSYDLPYVEVRNHGFAENGQWFIEDCPTTPGIDGKCPICKDVNLLWKDTSTIEIAKQRGKKVNWVANILVVKDMVNPENNGKVFLFKFGKKIKEKLWSKWLPAEGSVDEDEAINIWDYTEGANFTLKITRTAKDTSGKTRVDYSTSEFKMPKAIDESELERINKEMYDLREFVDPTKFKTYEQLLERYNKVIGVVGEESTPVSKSPSTRSETPKNQKQSVVVDEEELDSFITDFKDSGKSEDDEPDLPFDLD